MGQHPPLSAASSLTVGSGLGLWVRRRKALFYSLLSVAAFLVLWQLVVVLGLVSRHFISAPTTVVARGVHVFFVSGSIYPNLAVSLLEIAIGFGAGVLIGVPVGIAMGRVAWLKFALEPLVAVANSMPAVAFLPLLTIWFGIGLLPKVLLVFSGAIFVMIINTEAGVNRTDPRLIETARSLLASEHQILTKVILPSTVPYIMAGIRVSIGRVLIMMVIAEMFAATKGLGYLIINAGTSYDTPDVFLGVSILAVLGIVLTQIARSIEARFSSWRT